MRVGVSAAATLTVFVGASRSERMDVQAMAHAQGMDQFTEYV